MTGTREHDSGAATGSGGSRRTLLRSALAAGATAGGALALGRSTASAAPEAPPGEAPRPSPSPGEPSGKPRPTTPRQALAELTAGNRRWRALRQHHPHEARALRRELVAGQHPFALVLGCVDSRVPPELVFDQGLGDLLTVRSAGEVLDEAVLGSIAYGALELGIPLIVVLGHASCGAVAAAVEADETGERLPAHIQYLADQLRPAIDHALPVEQRVDAAITANVRRVRARLAAEPDLAARIREGKLAVTGARYELGTQLVHRLD
ncbi:carbonic anhydrase [Streptomyces sp. NPDC047097]|uniref:carbonic anhydrase n=1 Tax=Streptomyces sp. NPDC047097 TaxID=3155260 RepID=UPI0033E1371A